MMRKTGILCLLLGLAPLAEALPLWIRPDAKSGAFQVEQVQVRLSHFNTKWIGVEQKGGAVTGKATNSPDAFSFKGNWKVGNDSFTLEESIRLIEENVGQPVQFFAYPHGQTEPWADNFLKEHFAVTVTTRVAPADLSDGLYQLPRYNINTTNSPACYLPAG